MLKTYLNNVTGGAFICLQRIRIAEYALKNIEVIQTHAVVTLFMERVNLAASVLQSLSQMILIGTATALYLVLGLRLAPLEMLIAVGALAASLIPLKKLNFKISTFGEQLRLNQEAITRTLLGGLKHNFVLKIYGLLDREVEQSNLLLQRKEELTRFYYWVGAVKGSFPNLIGIVIVCLVTYVSVKLIHTSGIILLSFFYIFIRLAQGASELNAARAEYRLNLEAFKEVFHWHELLRTRSASLASEVHSKATPVEKDFFAQGVTLSFRDLSFGYAGGSELFKSINFKVAKGGLLLIRGESGVGKSTLLLLALGILKPNRGVVEINERPAHLIQTWIFDQIAYVGPDPFMVTGSLRENLIFGHHSPSTVQDGEMYEALRVAQLRDARFSLDLHIGEQTPLSTGQKQRISIARALLRKPALLILDEATANLDETTESVFITSVRPLLERMTTVVISHKSSFDSIATQVLKLDKLGSAYSN
jgi:ABC-type branched-subunit amino acid transport system ATPase component